MITYLIKKQDQNNAEEPAINNASKLLENINDNKHMLDNPRHQASYSSEESNANKLSEQFPG